MPKNLPEILFSCYFWGFVYLKPIVVNNPDSTLVLQIFVSSILCVFTLDILLFRRAIYGQWIIFISVVLFLYFLDVNIRQDNPIGQRYLYEFMFNAFIPSIIFNQISKPRTFLKCFSVLGIVAIVLFGFDGVNGYPLFGDYMGYGFNIVMPAFFSSLLAVVYFRKKVALLPLLFCLYNLVLFSNRGALLGSILFSFLLMALIVKNYKIMVLGTVLSAVVLLFLFLNIEMVLVKLIDYANSINISSYGLNQFATYFNGGDSDQLFSGRFELWEIALGLIDDGLWFGNGIGFFEVVHGVYSHNLILDFLIFHGLIGLLIYGYLIYRPFGMFEKMDTHFRVLALTMLLLMIPKLFLSGYFVSDMAFWCFMSLGFQKIKYAI